MKDIKKDIEKLDKSVDELGKKILEYKGKDEFKEIYLSYIDVIISLDKLKCEFDFKIKNYKSEWIEQLKIVKHQVDEIYKKEVWTSLYNYIMKM